MSTNILPRALAVTLAVGFTSAAMLAPAHATDGRTAAQMCIDRDDCTITPVGNGSFTLTLDGGGIIWCPDVNGQCILVVPDIGKVGQSPVAAPITKTPVAAAPGNPVTKTPAPIGTHPSPVGNHPTAPKPVGAPPIVFHPIPIHGQPIVFHPVHHKPTGMPSTPVILVRSSGHRR
jgi:hypothetical protein